MNGPVALSTTRARASNRAPVSLSVEHDAGDAAAAIAQQGLGAQVVGDGRAGGLRVEDVLEHQARVVGLAVDVGQRAREPRGAQVGRQLVELAGAELAAARGWAPQRERVVERDADAQRGERGLSPR